MIPCGAWCSITQIDGRWITDDYYEEKTLQKITEEGLKPGDPVGELPDPNANIPIAESSQNAAAARNERSNVGTAGPMMGIYRAGGPTTVFGASGWGPFSDGPLNAVRKSLLSRDGVTEENWMMAMAGKVLEAGQEWEKWRKAATIPGGGLDIDGIPMQAGKMDGVRGSPSKKRRKIDDQLPLGVYEPHTGSVFCESCSSAC